MNAREDRNYTENMILILSATVRALGSVLANNSEVVLHDLRHPASSIAEIVNPQVTGRKKGDSVLSGMRTDPAFINVMEIKNEPVSLLLDYETFSHEGKPLRSSTVLYRDQAGRPFAALCINVDNSVIEQAITLLQSFSGIKAQISAPPPPDTATEHHHDSIENLMHEIIGSTTAASPGNSRNDMKRANLMAVKSMQEKGIFLIKGGVEKAAAALGVTRYTIYNYLDELNNGDEPPAHTKT